jgi:hypothetical protein
MKDAVPSVAKVMILHDPTMGTALAEVQAGAQALALKFIVIDANDEAKFADGFAAAHYLGKYWSEWQDLNLRPPRPERGTRPPYSVRQQRLRPLFEPQGRRHRKPRSRPLPCVPRDFFPKASPTQLSGRLVVSSS